MKHLQTIMRIALPVLILATLGIAAIPVARHLAGISTDVPDTIARPSPARAEPSAPDLSALAVLAPFGLPAVAELPDTPAEETTLDLALRGIVLNARDPFALISANGTTQSYRVADEVTTGAILIEIEDSQVMLDVRGSRQVLSFPGRDVIVAAGETDEEPDPFDRLRGLVRTATPRPEEQEIRPETTEDYINLWRERLIRNPKQVLDQIGLTATENGYIIAQKHDIGVKLAGLRAGDLIASINGEPLGDVDADRKRYDEIAASGVARLEVIRDGQTLTMSFPLR